MCLMSKETSEATNQMIIQEIEKQNFFVQIDANQWPWGLVRKFWRVQRIPGLISVTFLINKSKYTSFWSKWIIYCMLWCECLMVDFVRNHVRKSPNKLSMFYIQASKKRVSDSSNLFFSLHKISHVTIRSYRGHWYKLSWIMSIVIQRISLMIYCLFGLVIFLIFVFQSGQSHLPKDFAFSFPLTSCWNFIRVTKSAKKQ